MPGAMTAPLFRAIQIAWLPIAAVGYVIFVLRSVPA